MPQARKWDASEFLDSPVAIAEYLTATIEEGGNLNAAIGTAAKAVGMSSIAEGSGLGRESLYKALSESGDPKMSTILAVLEQLGVKIEIRAA